MKILILIGTILLSFNISQAQDASSQQDIQSKPEQSEQQQSSPQQSSPSDDGLINEPSGAEKPEAQDPSSQPEVKEPSGAQPSDTPPSYESNETKEPAGANQQQNQQDQQSQGLEQQSQSEDLQANEAAGAPRGQSAQLQSALTQFKSGATASENQKMKLRQAITASVQGNQKLPDEFADRLVTDLTSTLSTISIEQDAHVRLAEALSIVLSAQPSSRVQVERALKEVQTVLIDSGAERPAARAILCDLHLIATEVAPGLTVTVPTVHVAP